MVLRLYKEKYMSNKILDKEINEYWNNENFIPEKYLRIFGDENER